jgi:GxxExxY protein
MREGRKVNQTSSDNRYEDASYPHSALTSRIIACAVEVHKTLGPGFEEVFYQRALHKELAAASLEASREVWIDVEYKGVVLGKKRVDFVVEDVLVEIKAKAALEDVDKVQTLSYLKASGYPVGLLINFGGPKIDVVRLANTKPRKPVAAGATPGPPNR